MILRLSSKLATKLKVTTPAVLPLDPNPLADWSAHLFVAERSQLVIVTNSASLYSVLFQGRGIGNGKQFVEQVLTSLQEFMEFDGQGIIYERFVAPASDRIQFSKALSRSVISSMNDLIIHARDWLTLDGLSAHETAKMLNDIPFSSLEYGKPREAFRAMANI